MSDQYMPSEVAGALRGNSLDPDLVVDVEVAFTRLPHRYLQVLTDFANGYSEEEAGRRAGAKNGRRLYDEAIRCLTDLANGK